jgi:hypothetical protein
MDWKYNSSSSAPAFASTKSSVQSPVTPKKQKTKTKKPKKIPRGFETEQGTLLDSLQF